jgi:arylsulfatase A-like enzyme
VAHTAALDKEIGRLCDELDRRGVLERTWVVITSDHGYDVRDDPRERHSGAPKALNSC